MKRKFWTESRIIPETQEILPAVATLKHLERQARILLRQNPRKPSGAICTNWSQSDNGQPAFFKRKRLPGS
jgi:hypothetical protein